MPKSYEFDKRPGHPSTQVHIANRKASPASWMKRWVSQSSEAALSALKICTQVVKIWKACIALAIVWQNAVYESTEHDHSGWTSHGPLDSRAHRTAFASPRRIWSASERGKPDCVDRQCGVPSSVVKSSSSQTIHEKSGRRWDSFSGHHHIHDRILDTAHVACGDEAQSIFSASLSSADTSIVQLARVGI